MSPIILRLRHLRAVYGRNFDVFCHEYGSAVGITFALSSVDSDDIGYYYVSEVATNIENPEWEPVEMNSLPKQYRASKVVLFTFFLVYKESNSLLFEMLVHFSGLVLTDSEMRESMCVPCLKDQVFFQMGSHIWAPRKYFTPDVINAQMWSKGNSRPVIKLSYDFSSLQKFLVNKEAIKVQLKRIKYMQSLANVLRSSLHNLISQGLTAEQISVAIDSVKRRTEATKYSISIARNKVKQLEVKIPLYFLLLFDDLITLTIIPENLKLHWYGSILR
ncbi:unnamed protein product [Heterobilharzia americana]|nr:unnamed protein product [Heterobilharzia americana]